MKKAVHSFRHALRGLHNAIRKERNLKIFLMGYGFILLWNAYRDISKTQWLLLIVSGNLFIVTELLNTSLERFVDTFEEYRLKLHPERKLHHGLMLTKDIAAAASLISLLTVICVIGIMELS